MIRPAAVELILRLSNPSIFKPVCNAPPIRHLRASVVAGPENVKLCRDNCVEIGFELPWESGTAAAFSVGDGWPVLVVRRQQVAWWYTRDLLMPLGRRTANSIERLVSHDDTTR